MWKAHDARPTWRAAVQTSSQPFRQSNPTGLAAGSARRCAVRLHIRIGLKKLLTHLTTLRRVGSMSHRNTNALTETALLVAGRVVALRGLVLGLVLVLLITSGGAG